MQFYSSTVNKPLPVFLSLDISVSIRLSAYVKRKTILVFFTFCPLSCEQNENISPPLFSSVSCSSDIFLNERYRVIVQSANIIIFLICLHSFRVPWLPEKKWYRNDENAENFFVWFLWCTPSRIKTEHQKCWRWWLKVFCSQNISGYCWWCVSHIFCRQFYHEQEKEESIRRMHCHGTSNDVSRFIWLHSSRKYFVEKIFIKIIKAIFQLLFIIRLIFIFK